MHRAEWPDAAPLRAAAGDGDPLVFTVASEVLGEIRKAKTTAHRSLRADVRRVVVRDTPERLAALALAAEDVREAGRVEALETVEAETFSVDVELAEPDAS